MVTVLLRGDRPATSEHSPRSGGNHRNRAFLTEMEKTINRDAEIAGLLFQLMPQTRKHKKRRNIISQMSSELSAISIENYIHDGISEF